eukprot:gb/GFBE01076635.1/.p1 GENE.gb/GFBE01076635.1/~~gb/GFBE01076635.1/.p1  ORF type:complete len:374 (+),score=65.53 gb/GFBE01076635.1/:1-1122(+)
MVFMRQSFAAPTLLAVAWLSQEAVARIDSQPSLSGFRADPKLCCADRTAKCLACQQGMTVQELCALEALDDMPGCEYVEVPASTEPEVVPPFMAKMMLLQGKEEQTLTYRRAQEECAAATKNGDTWHLCTKGEVEQSWTDLMKDTSDAYGFRAWADQGSFTESGCIYNGRQSSANAMEPMFACGYPQETTLEALCCVTTANVTHKTGGARDSNNYTEAKALCAAYGSHLCSQDESEDFLGNIKLGERFTVWGSNGCKYKTATRTWDCEGESANQTLKHDALCCLTHDPVTELTPSRIGDPWYTQDHIDCSNKAVIHSTGGCSDYDNKLSLCNQRLEIVAGVIVHCVTYKEQTCRPSGVRCIRETCGVACQTVR